LKPRTSHARLSRIKNQTEQRFKKAISKNWATTNRSSEPRSKPTTNIASKSKSNNFYELSAANINPRKSKLRSDIYRYMVS
jgi:hypothetical protein